MIQKKQYKKNGYFVFGILLLILGSGMAILQPSLLFYGLFPLGMLIAGLIFIKISDRTSATKLAWIITPILIFLSVQIIAYEYKRPSDELFLIHDGYRGKVRIYFNKTCGPAIRREYKKRLFEIPENGILLTASNYEEHDASAYFLIDKKGKRTPLAQFNIADFNEDWKATQHPHEPSRDIPGIFNIREFDNNGGYEFYVCTYRQLMDSFDFEYHFLKRISTVPQLPAIVDFVYIYNLHFDSTESKLLQECEKKLGK